LHPLIIALTLVVIIAAALSLGIILGYAAVAVMLHAMRRRPQRAPERALTATEASSGD
jgi:hypothetical protein